MKIKEFLITTKTLSRVLFFVWLSFVTIFSMVSLSGALSWVDLLAAAVGYSSFFLVPAALIEYRNNPVLISCHKQKPKKSHWFWGIVVLELTPLLAMAGILGSFYSQEPGLLILLILSIFLFIYGVLLINGFITKKSIERKKLIEELEQQNRYNSICEEDYSSFSTPAYDITVTDGMDGHDFEYFCANLLINHGFSDVSVTPGSGDQGVDILATKAGIKYAIQCKCYTTPLSNKPIQEVNAGKMYYNCHVGVVMTNSTFTSSAMELAKATNVLLWDRITMQQMMWRS